MKVTPIALNELKKILDTEESPLAGIRIFAQQGAVGKFTACLSLRIKNLTLVRIKTFEYKTHSNCDH
jgi:Fe-S cluster assembly iron-binding protein IscA